MKDNKLLPKLLFGIIFLLILVAEVNDIGRYVRAKRILRQGATVNAVVSDMRLWDLLQMPMKKASKTENVCCYNTDTRKYLKERNRKIFEAYRKGLSIAGLAAEFSLSEKSIQRIIRDAKKAEPKN